MSLLAGCVAVFDQFASVARFEAVTTFTTGRAFWRIIIESAHNILFAAQLSAHNIVCGIKQT